MAHRVNVTQVGADIKPDEAGQKVKCPTCQREIERRESKHMLFRGDDTFFFCSKDCQVGFLTKPKERRLAS
ncbi:MAG TPA: hypothetical protein VJB59_10375 [Bdellovibrionota bacterium]|nr:hypothetical protein [Bdellovibrionota bacterium]